jgi:hypothetical protein
MMTWWDDFISKLNKGEIKRSDPCEIGSDVLHLSRLSPSALLESFYHYLQDCGMINGVKGKEDINPVASKSTTVSVGDDSFIEKVVI